jgi:hypothetical protein
MAKNLAERVLALVDKAEPLERLRLLQELQEAAPAIRSAALAELVDEGWTRYAIAQELGISHQAIGKWR